MRNWRLAALAITAAALSAFPVAAQETRPDPQERMTVELTRQLITATSQMLSFACKASPGEKLDVCEAAIVVRRALDEAKPAGPATPSRSADGPGR